MLADVTLAVALSAMQFVVLEQLRSAFTADRSLLHYGSPLGLLLGPGLYVLCRPGKKSRRRFTLDVIVAAALLIVFSAMILSIGQAVPSSSEVLEWLVFLTASVAEAVLLLFTERMLRNARGDKNRA